MDSLANVFNDYPVTDFLQVLLAIFLIPFGIIAFYRQYLSLKRDRREISGADSGENSRLLASLKKDLDQVKRRQERYRVENTQAKQVLEGELREAMSHIDVDALFIEKKNEIWERFSKENF